MLVLAAKRCCKALNVKDLHRESIWLDGQHEQDLTCPQVHDQLVQLQCLAAQTRVAVDLAWLAPPDGNPDRPAMCSDAIQFRLKIKVLFKLPLRQTSWMVASLLKMAGLGRPGSYPPLAVAEVACRRVPVAAAATLPQLTARQQRSGIPLDQWQSCSQPPSARTGVNGKRTARPRQPLSMDRWRKMAHSDTKPCAPPGTLVGLSGCDGQGHCIRSRTEARLLCLKTGGPRIAASDPIRRKPDTHSPHEALPGHRNGRNHTGRLNPTGKGKATPKA